MKLIVGRVESVYLGRTGDDLAKEPCAFLQAELDGFVGDRHRSAARRTWEGDKQPEGTTRRNERQWSAISAEELAAIEQQMDLKEHLSAASVGVNLCFEGIPELSQLPRGTILKFPSGAELMVEEYNPPCLEMGQKLAAMYTSNSGEPLADTAFSQASKFCHGLVGVIEVAGVINAGDEVSVVRYQPPIWLTRLEKG
ncbi:MAG: hypothetical protein O7F73_21390 [Gammaproteobacteria bacterium]|nr:hypothetical protein [Gammaproteobacteria bacterium]